MVVCAALIITLVISSSSMPLLILLRHGESVWNPPAKKSSNNPAKGWRYAGAVDVPLSEDGIADAIRAGHALQTLPLDVVYSSMLIRAQMTALIALASHDQEQTPLLVRDEPDSSQPRGLRAHVARMYQPPAPNDEESSGEYEEETNRIIPVYCSHALNERDFGDLQGMHNREQRRRFRLNDLEHWRTAWDAKFPNGESSADVSARVVRFFEKHIRRQLDSGNNVMVVAHGFVQRVLIKHLLGMNDVEWEHHSAFC
jgi:2,3-bisphosphoglycerate-dependent phosphoglycerate mutase